ncbi:unnamed protein product [Soboliphyme baturini]|uniref:Transferrin-like domain-containing protein n=1 Tax=Soboliphyme baturini TaxID=241478 RepID=A0A183IFJ6_9BILA|nr:unnamed protein product [Soboliphyme baturini]
MVIAAPENMIEYESLIPTVTVRKHELGLLCCLNYFTVWSQWTDWSQCQQSKQMRVRGCVTVPGKKCPGSNSELRQCIEERFKKPDYALQTHYFEFLHRLSQDPLPSPGFFTPPPVLMTLKLAFDSVFYMNRNLTPCIDGLQQLQKRTKRFDTFLEFYIYIKQIDKVHDLITVSSFLISRAKITHVIGFKN